MLTGFRNIRNHPTIHQPLGSSSGYSRQIRIVVSSYGHSQVINVTAKDAYPLPSTDNTEALHCACYFSIWDLKIGYWQKPAWKEDKQKRPTSGPIQAICTSVN